MKKMPKFRSGLFLLAMKRNGGKMKDKRSKRVDRKSWRKEVGEQ